MGICARDESGSAEQGRSARKTLGARNRSAPDCLWSIDGHTDTDPRGSRIAVFFDIGVIKPELSKSLFDDEIEGLAGYALLTACGGDPHVDGDVG